MMDTAWTDGGRRDDRVSWGFVICDSDGNLILKDSGSEERQRASSGVAEYLAALRAVRAYKGLHRSGPLRVCTDCCPLFDFISTDREPSRKVKHYALWVALRKEIKRVPFLTVWEKIPRKQNKGADALAHRALGPDPRIRYIVRASFPGRASAKTAVGEARRIKGINVFCQAFRGRPKSTWFDAEIRKPKALEEFRLLVAYRGGTVAPAPPSKRHPLDP